ncbi:MAG: ribosome assembly cofactor RimP [Flavobacteriaceae bacterium]
MFKELVTQLLQAGLDERNDLFLIDFSISADHKIKVVIDGDNGVTVQDCIFISRAIEHNIDRDEHDFSLDVTSCGATNPLTIKRQYSKNIGRELEVKLVSSKSIEGELTKVDENKITLEWDAREPKPIGKGKVTVHKVEEIAFSDIVEAKVMIKF